MIHDHKSGIYYILLQSIIKKYILLQSQFINYKNDNNFFFFFL
jgi:hypothetical protein